jgi:hypothetical protein
MIKDQPSKQILLDWVNSSLETNYSKVEQLADCIAYVQLLHRYAPEAARLDSLKCKLMS